MQPIVGHLQSDRYLPPVLFTPTPILLAWVAALGTIGHANIDMRLPRFLHRLVMTPQVHRIHHGQEVELALANYANVFPVWDVLFGTFRDPTRVQPARFGIEDDVLATTLWQQVAAPFAWQRTEAGHRGGRP